MQVGTFVPNWYLTELDIYRIETYSLDFRNAPDGYCHISRILTQRPMESDDQFEMRLICAESEMTKIRNDFRPIVSEPEVSLFVEVAEDDDMEAEPYLTYNDE